jgi:2-succinyl-6-hydroxy-2,4-cyclohexadiene-1-carboxylate synthase
MTYTEINGLALYYDRYGFGPPVVMLHGFTGSRTTWLDLVRELQDSFCTFSFDLIGHGRSGSPQEIEHYLMNNAVDDLVSAVRSLGIEKAVWLGYSLGGRTALQVWKRHPDVVSGLILEGASSGIATCEERNLRRESDEALAQLLVEDGIEAFVGHWESMALWKSQKINLSESSQVALQAQRLAQREIGLANSLRGMGTGAQSWLGEDLKNIEVPVLLIAGSLDDKYSQIAREMAEQIPDSQVELIADAGHASHIEKPEQVHKVIKDFLLRHRKNL